MVQTKEKQRKLFRVTTKRDIIFGRASQMIDMSIQSKEYGLQILEYSTKLSAEEVVSKQQTHKADIARYQEVQDVLSVVRFHQKDYLLTAWLHEDRGWLSEWDVPLNVFERAISTIIELIEGYKERTWSRNPESRYGEPIQLLQELLAFRQS